MTTAKPNVNLAWAQTGAVTPPSDPRISAGWVVEKPPYQTANFVENRQDTFIKHINENGIALWDAITSYSVGNITMGPDNNIYQSLQNLNVNNNPVSSPAFWVMSLSSPKGFSAFQTGVSLITSNVETKVPFNSVTYNYNSEYNNSTYDFTPQTKGDYLITSMVEIGLVSQIGTPLGNSYIAIYKNGSSFIRNSYGYDPANGYTHFSPSISAIVPMNGTGDYISIYGVVSSASPGFAFQNILTVPFFQATKV